MKNYKYTLLKQDGSTENLGNGKRKNFDDFRKILNCSTIEIIPEAYYKEKGYYTCYGDEEGRFNSENERNPHFKVLKGDQTLGEPAEWDVVGNIIREETYPGN